MGGRVKANVPPCFLIETGSAGKAADTGRVADERDRGRSAGDSAKRERSADMSADDKGVLRSPSQAGA